MECYFRSKPVDENGVPIRGYRKRMFQEWRNRGMFQSTEQRICDQARAIRKNGWLTDAELEGIKRKISMEETINDEEPSGTVENNNEEPSGEESEIADEQLQDIEDIVENDQSDIHIDKDMEHDLSPDQRKMVDEILEIMKSNESNDNISFKRVDQNQLNDVTKRVNDVIMYIQTNTITETNNLIKAASVFVARQLGLKKGTKKKTNEPWWKRRIENDIKRIRHDVNILEREKKGHLKRRVKFEVLVKKYNTKNKGLSVVIEELKQRQLAKSAKIKRYEQRIKQYRQNRLFQTDQRKLYQELNGEVRAENVIPNAEES